MAKQTNNPKYMKFVEFARQNNGVVTLNDPALAALLGKTLYRVSNYVWNARKQQKLEVIAVRNGKTVVAYEFPAFKALAGVSETVEPVEVVESIETPAVSEPVPASV
jgi:hypothetical protein